MPKGRSKKENVQRCYIYTRVSTKDQVEGYSLEAQEERLRKEAAFRNMKVIEPVFSDKGKSGKNTTQRDEFRSMIEKIENGNEDNVDYVLVFKLSRFGRNTADVLSNLQLMQDYGVNLLAVEENIDSAGPAGKLMISVIAAVAEIERENIREQTMAGRREKARQGKWNGGQAPFGYQLEKGKLVIDEEEAKIVRLIFDRFLNYSGIAGVAKYLNDTGYRRDPRGNGKFELFSTHFVKMVLDNPVYAGKIAYGRRATEKIDGKRNEYHVVKQDEYPVYEGEHDAIIDEETWAAVRQKRETTGKAWEKTYSLEHEHILSGILKCPVCGASMYGSVNRKKKKDGSGRYKDGFYYVCKHRKLIDGQRCTYKKQPPQDPINDEVIKIVQVAYRSPTFARSLYEQLNEELNENEIKDRLAELRATRNQYVARKDKLGDEIDNLDALAANYDMMYEDMSRRLRRLYDEIAQTDIMIGDAERALREQSSEQATMEAAMVELQQFSEILPTLTDAQKKEVVQAVLERVELYPERQENGRYVKAVKFQFPVLFEGETPTDWWYTEEHDETVVLMSRKDT